jgi:glutaredoxin
VLRGEGHSERAIFVIDKSGRVRFAKVYPMDEQPDNEELFSVLAVLEPLLSARWAAAEAKRAALSGAQGGAAPGKPVVEGVIMYCTPWCPECRRARAFLRRNNIEYVEVDVSRDRKAAEALRKWTGGPETTPSFNLNGTVQIGFNEEAIALALGFDPVA